MGDYFKKVAGQIGEFLSGLTPARKVAMGLTTAGIAAVLGVLFFWAGSTTYKPLMTNLSPEDSTNIIRILREKNIPFRVDEGGKSVSIPPESVYDLRLELATMGLPQSGTVGYELFDKQALGTTSYVQNVNHKRALEGELMRTISTIQGVRRSRVHLAIPKKSTFVEDQKKVSASVVLDLAPGVRLAERQIYGIGNLVSSAVEGLDVAEVVIVDSQGKVLSKNTRDPLMAETADQLDYRRKVEVDLEKRVQDILSRVVGEGNVVAQVTADLDFSRVQETQTMFDPDGSAVHSVQRHLESMEGRRPGPRGLAGAATNLPGEAPPANDQIRTDTNKNREVTNYQNSKTVRMLTKPYGTISRLSVAVVVNGKRVQKEVDGAVRSVVEPWSPEKLKEFESLVASAVGIAPKRGDSIEIKNLEFTHEDFDEAQRIIEENERRAYIQNMIVYSVIGLIIILFFLFVVRPFIKWITENTVDSVDTFLPQTIEELERLQRNANLPGLEDTVPIIPEKIDPDKVEGEMIKEKIVTLVDSNPQKAALVLKEWLTGAEKRSAPQAEAQG